MRNCGRRRCRWRGIPYRTSDYCTSGIDCTMTASANVNSSKYPGPCRHPVRLQRLSACLSACPALFPNVSLILRLNKSQAGHVPIQVAAANRPPPSLPLSVTAREAGGGHFHVKLEARFLNWHPESRVGTAGLTASIGPPPIRPHSSGRAGKRTGRQAAVELNHAVVYLATLGDSKSVDAAAAGAGDRRPSSSQMSLGASSSNGSS